MRVSKTARRSCLALAAAAALWSAGDAKGQWVIETYSNPSLGTITNLATADALVGGFHLQSGFPVTWSVPLLNTQDNNDAGGPFGLGTQVGGLPAGDNDDFVVQGGGLLNVTTAGSYTFVNNTDDGSRLRISVNGGPLQTIITDDVLSGPHDAASAPVALNAGDTVNLEWTWFERGGGAEGETYYRRGAGANALQGDASQGLNPAGPFSLRTYKSQVTPGTTLNSFADADPVRTPGLLKGSGLLNVFNLQNDGGSSGDFASDDAVPGVPVGADDFITVGTGKLVVRPDQAGTYTFRSNTDDGGRLLIDLNRDGDLTDPGDVVILQDVLQGPTNSDSLPVNLTAGLYNIEYSFFERGGGAEGEVSARFGSTGPFILLGDEAAGGLDVVPEPGSMSLLGIASLLTLRRRRA